ncbi:MAG TPA: energy transducer TonB [Flavobacteriia bacterium]|jgi:protein TonB|nr:energy transducer TonB [Flavobacteriia bacterium]
MESKKSDKAKLENYSKLFVQLGLVLSLLIVYFSLEFKFYDRDISDLTGVTSQEEVEEDIPITERLEIIKPPPPPPPAPEVIEIVEDQTEIEETVLESTETDESEAVEVVDISDIEEVVEEEDIIEEVPFAVIEEAPIYPGCKGSKAAKKKCLQQKIRELVNKKFNTGLAEELGLDPGRKKVYVLFKIDYKGNVVDVRARGPHKRLEKEAIRVVNLLPKMIPAKQRGKPVNIKYTLPITLDVQ